jgi:hypothetical protein
MSSEPRIRELEGRSDRRGASRSEFENERLRPRRVQNEGRKGSEGRNRVSEEDPEDEMFGLDQYASKVHLGKPSGAIHDSVLDEMRRHLLKYSLSEDAEKAQTYLASIREHKAFEKQETRGRFLWNVLRSYGLKLDEQELKHRVWASRQIIQAWSHGNRAGYLWGVMIDALNKSDLWELCEELWHSFSEKMNESPEEYAEDLPFVITARLSGAIDTFQYPLVDSMLSDLANCSSADMAAWALVRCLQKSIMIHQNIISGLPNWNGKPLSSVELRAAHFAPLLADAGCVEAARGYWIQDHTALYKHEAPIPNHPAEARLEMEHLRAGLLVFARSPRLQPPHDTILALIVERFDRLLRAHPQLCIHNHGLLYSLVRSDYFWLNSHLAHSFLELGSSATIVSVAMIQMCLRNGDAAGYQYWLAKRNADQASHFKLHDRFHQWIIFVSTLPMHQLLNHTISTSFPIPLQYLDNADSIIRARYEAGKHSKPNDNEELNLERNTELEDGEMDLEAEKPLVFESGANLSDAPPAGSDASTIAPYITRSNPKPSLPPITEEEYLEWQKWVSKLVSEAGVGLQDLHNTQKLVLGYTVPCRFKEAEMLLLAPYRTHAAKKDVAVIFLMTCYAEHRMFSQMIEFAKKVVLSRPSQTLDRLVGPAKILALFHRLVALEAPSFYILELWSVVHTPNLISALLPILSNAATDFGDTKRAESLAEELFQAARFRITPEAIPAAEALQRWMNKHRRFKMAHGLAHWIDEYRRAMKPGFKDSVYHPKRRTTTPKASEDRKLN